MAWPNTAIDTEHLDEGSDSPADARPDILAAVEALNDIRTARGVADGVASLDGDGKIPPAELPDFARGIQLVGGVVGHSANSVVGSVGGAGKAVQSINVDAHGHVTAAAAVDADFTQNISEDQARQLVAAQVEAWARIGGGDVPLNRLPAAALPQVDRDDLLAFFEGMIPAWARNGSQVRVPITKLGGQTEIRDGSLSFGDEFTRVGIEVRADSMVGNSTASTREAYETFIAANPNGVFAYNPMRGYLAQPNPPWHWLLITGVAERAIQVHYYGRQNPSLPADGPIGYWQRPGKVFDVTFRLVTFSRS